MMGSRKEAHQIRAWLPVYFIMGSQDCTRNPVDVLEEAISGGITVFQFREKGSNALTGDAKMELAKTLQALCKSKGVPFIINDDIELALALDADGVHIGQEDESAAIVRKRLGPEKILGVSAHSKDEALQAIADGADYLGVGPIFPTQSKADAKPVSGTILIETLRSQGIEFPLVGIGGITPQNAHVVMEAGADGVSVISSISRAPSVLESTRQLADVVYQSRLPK